MKPNPMQREKKRGGRDSGEKKELVESPNKTSTSKEKAHHNLGVSSPSRFRNYSSTSVEIGFHVQKKKEEKNK